MMFLEKINYLGLDKITVLMGITPSHLRCEEQYQQALNWLFYQLILCYIDLSNRPYICPSVQLSQPTRQHNSNPASQPTNQSGSQLANQPYIFGGHPSTPCTTVAQLIAQCAVDLRVLVRIPLLVVFMGCFILFLSAHSSSAICLRYEQHRD